VLISTEYFTKIRPFFQSQTLEGEELSIFDRTTMANSIIHITNRLKKYFQVLYVAGILRCNKSHLSSKIMKLGSFIKSLLDDLTGDDVYGEPVQYKELDLDILEERITGAITQDVQSILKGNQKRLEEIVDSVMSFLDFNAEKRNYFKSLCIIISSFIIDLSCK
jgi:hypothetical protein